MVDHRAIIWAYLNVVYQVMLLTKYQGYRPSGFRQEDCFYVFTLWVDCLKKVNMARKRYTQKLQTDPRHCQKESKNNNSHTLTLWPPGWGPFDHKTTIWTHKVEYQYVMLHINYQNFKPFDIWREYVLICSPYNGIYKTCDPRMGPFFAPVPIFHQT